jgi:hypothetical protein
MTRTARQLFSFRDYIELEEESTVKHEFLDGWVWAMAEADFAQRVVGARRPGSRTGTPGIRTGAMLPDGRTMFSGGLGTTTGGWGGGSGGVAMTSGGVRIGGWAGVGTCGVWTGGGVTRSEGSNPRDSGIPMVGISVGESLAALSESVPASAPAPTP